MPEKSNENIIQEATKRPETESGAGLEISPSPELTSVANSLNDIKQAVDHNQPVELSQLQKIQEAIKKITVNVGGEDIPIEELKNIPDLKKNMEIWKEIRQGKLDNTNKLTYLPIEIADCLSQCHQDIILLHGLKSLSDKAAEFLSHHQGELSFDNLSSLSDKAIEHLSHHKGGVSFGRLFTSLSDKAAEYLSHHQGGLYLYGLVSLSDKAAEYLSHHLGYLSLEGLVSLSDQAAEYLSHHHQGGLSLAGLMFLSDQAAEHLSHHQGSLNLRGLYSLSDQAAKYLAKCKGDITVQEDIQEKINKFRK